MTDEVDIFQCFWVLSTKFPLPISALVKENIFRKIEGNFVFKGTVSDSGEGWVCQQLLSFPLTVSLKKSVRLQNIWTRTPHLSGSANSVDRMNIFFLQGQIWHMGSDFFSLCVINIEGVYCMCLCVKSSLFPSSTPPWQHSTKEKVSVNARAWDKTH